MYSMFSTPFTCCSMGAATVSATTWALAPGYEADTSTVGGVISGYWATGSVNSAMLPARTMTIDRTDAKIGRWMKNRENTTTASLLFHRLGAAVRRGGRPVVGWFRSVGGIDEAYRMAVRAPQVLAVAGRRVALITPHAHLAASVGQAVSVPHRDHRPTGDKANPPPLERSQHPGHDPEQAQRQNADEV